ncbi:MULTISPECIES: inorganic phosphate transporter [unclassified Devosia]|uniref:inorganic phosphate transporter n=1 Tax=unclassified Devosia TaxID=196773 RepID=UPI00145E5AAF|nr:MULTISPECIES: inorganic phosphate transporter [unclassified Devosia]MBJ6986583.1 inorganic phosphate transporter [Devosia sp. MC521]MBJ7577048.1 inorganic phosphate transporter [Devosia sp. MC532]QMW61626.1 inorganic phosphate transporter [Devosia sp. MC521]
MSKSALDKDLQRVSGMETATFNLTRSLAAPGIALVFLLLAAVWASYAMGGSPGTYIVVISACIAGYMALNVGANDVANNMGPAVGARAITMGGALVIAAIFEAAGALLAGGDVVNTVARDLLIAPDFESKTFITVMMSALLASALWVNLATYIGAPVSTTHAVVGGVVGSGIAAAGFGVVNWGMIGAIATSWVISPVMGGLCAAGLLWLIMKTITNRLDKISAARVWVPILVALMTGVFAIYLATKGMSRIWKPELPIVVTLFFVFTALGWIVSMPIVRKQSMNLENRKKHVATLFRIPLVISAALLSFAHGANDVANAIGPMAAIVSAIESGGADAGGISLPFWVLAIGAIGISLGLALFGPRLIRTVGEQITKLNEIRAFCAALSAAVTVLVASALGMPVSSTHIAVGAVFGVGFLREYFSRRDMEGSAVPVNAKFVDPSQLNATPEEALANARKSEGRLLVRRQHVYSIAAAWVVTVPASAVLSGVLYYVLSLIIR